LIIQNTLSFPGAFLLVFAIKTFLGNDASRYTLQEKQLPRELKPDK
jgi:hypothetical protein